METEAVAYGGQNMANSYLGKAMASPTVAPSPPLSERVLGLAEEITKNLCGALSEQSHLRTRLFGEDQGKGIPETDPAPSIEARISAALSVALDLSRAVRQGAETINSRI